MALSVLARQRRQKTRDRNSRTKTFQIIEEKISRNSHAKAWLGLGLGLGLARTSHAKAWITRQV